MEGDDSNTERSTTETPGAMCWKTKKYGHCEKPLIQKKCWKKKCGKWALVYFAFATLSKLVLFYFAVSISDGGLWRQAKCFLSLEDTSFCDADHNSQLYLSSAFEVSGLGNLLFQYASMYGIAMTTGRQPVIPKNLRLRSYFPHLTASVQNDSRPGVTWEQYTSPRASMYLNYIEDAVNVARHNAELVGYFQSWMYFKLCSDKIRAEFSFDPTIRESATSIVNEAKSVGRDASSNTFIGVHIRRGDMTRADLTLYGYTVVDKNYIDNAMARMEEKHADIIYIVCSDDISWCRKNIDTSKRKVYFSEGHRDIEDLAVLSQCNHTIMSTGTFSWWAAFLAGGHTLYYDDYPATGSRLEREFSNERKDYFLPNWTPIGPRNPV